MIARQDSLRTESRFYPFRNEWSTAAEGGGPQG
jgi:hypothetical protein